MTVSDLSAASKRWSELSPCERQSLELIYQATLESQAAARNRWFTTPKDTSSKSAEEIFHKQPYPKLPYGDISPIRPTRIKSLLQRAGQTDAIALATFSSLTAYGIIELHEKPPATDFQISVQLTAQGHETVRSQAEESLPSLHKGALTSTGWQLLAIACQAPKGQLKVAPDQIAANTSLAQWQELIKRERPLVELIYDHRLLVTPFGYVFYSHYWTHYQALYVKVDAPQPTWKEADIEQKLRQAKNWPTLARLKRGDRSLSQAASMIDYRVTPASLYRFEKGQPLSPDQRQLIMSWLTHAQ